MLTHPTLDLLHELGLHGMAKGFKALEQASETRTLEHGEWLALLLEHEVTLRRQKRFEARVRAAHLRHNASVEDVDYRACRGLIVRSSSNSLPAIGSANVAIAW